MGIDRGDRCKNAVNAFNNGYNCAQAIVAAFPEHTGSGREEALRQASGFGGGMGRLQSFCGALTGSFMVIGLAAGGVNSDEEEKNLMAGMIQEAASSFEKIHGTMNCAELIKINLNSIEGRKLHKVSPVRKDVCEKCICDSIAITCDILERIKGERNG
jgi:C_GCAxxG_C_C family probable redox protein